MAEENQPPHKKARFKENENEQMVVPAELVESIKEFIAKLSQDSSFDPSPIPGTSTEHIPSPPTGSSLGVLRDYILFDSTDPLTLPTIPCTGFSSSTTTRKTTRTTTRTGSFDPGAELEWRRLPVGVLKVVDFHTKMRLHLERILEHKYATEVALPVQRRIKGAFGFLTMVDTDYEPFSTEGSVDLHSTRLLSVITALYCDLTGKPAHSGGQVPDRARTVITDKTVTLEDQIQLLWEDKAPSVFDYHLDQLQQSFLGSPSEPLSFPWKRFRWNGWQSILAKLVWHATDRDGFLVKWAILYGGTRYVVILHIHVKDSGGDDRPFVFVSPPKDYNDPTFPITSVALYMLLSSEMSQEALMEELGIPDSYSTLNTPPLGPILKSRIPTGPTATVKDLLNDEFPSFFVHLPSKLARMMYRKGVPCDSIPEYDPPNSKTPVIELGEIRKHGSTAVVYQSEFNEIVLKVFISDEVKPRNGWGSDGLNNEEETLAILRNAEMVNVPKPLGQFVLGGQNVLAMTYEGESPSSLDSLLYPNRVSIYTDLVAMHAAGVLHGDLAARNVVMRPERPPVIIDFSHSQVGHSCLGEALCNELIDARKLLALGDADLSGMEEYRASSL